MKYGQIVRGLGVGAVALCAVIGCKKTVKDNGAAASSAPSAQTKTSEVDQELLKALEEIKTGCTVDVEASRVSDCKKQEKRQLAMTFARQNNERVKVLPTLAFALASDDKQLSTVAATMLYASFRSSFGKAEPGSVSAETAKLMIDTIPKLGRSQAAQSVATAVHAAMLAKQQDALYKMLDSSDNPALASVGYRHLMTYGGVDALPKIKQIVTGPQIAQGVSALESIRSAEALEGEHKDELCGYAQEVLADKRLPISAKAGSILARCGGKYIDALLDDSEKRLAEGQFSTAHARSLREPCMQRAGRRVGNGTDEQCERNRKFLVSALDNKDLQSAIKADILIALSEQWPDDKTAKLAKKYLKDKDPRLSKRAEDAIKRIEREKDMMAHRDPAPVAPQKKPAPAPAPVKPAAPAPAPAKPAAPAPVPAAPAAP